MNRYSSDELKPNTAFTAQVYLDDEYILLSPDVMLTRELIDRLKRWDYREVFSEGQPRVTATRPTPADLGMTTAVLDTDIKDKQNLEIAKKLYYSLINFLKNLIKGALEDNLLDLDSTTEKVKELIQAIKQNREAIMNFSELQYPGENYLYRHSVNVSIMALAIGEVLKLPPHRLIELGIGALLHDIGMFKIPEKIYLTERALSPQERKMINAHPILGYRILKGFSISEDIALTALEHHERLDGSGYPQALTGNKIVLNARIVAVACTYEAIISRRSFKQERDGHLALMELLRARQKLYDDVAVRALVICLSLYPIGTTVLLSDRSIGRVVRINPDSAKHPIVKLLSDAEGNALADGPVVKTSEERGLTVKRSLSPKEMQNLNQEVT